MSNFIKWLLISNIFLFSFIIAITSPTVHLYFMQHVDPQIYIIANVISTSLAAILSSVMAKEAWRNKIKKLFTYVLIVDSIMFAVITMHDISDVSFRFIGLAILGSITNTIWATIIIDSVNQSIKGTELTNFQTLESSSRLWASVAGGGVAIFAVSYLTLEQAIWMQCISNGVFAFGDWKAYRILNTGKEVC